MLFPWNLSKLLQPLQILACLNAMIIVVGSFTLLNCEVVAYIHRAKHDYGTIVSEHLPFPSENYRPLKRHFSFTNCKAVLYALLDKIMCCKYLPNVDIVLLISANFQVEVGWPPSGWYRRMSFSSSSVLLDSQYFIHMGNCTRAAV